LASYVYQPMDSKTFISPYSQSLFDMGVQDSRVYLSRQVNNILQVFGSNVKISGLDITINNNNKLINNKIASFTVSPGKCIVDTTLHIFPTATTLELDVSPYDPSGYLVIVVSYKYIESLQQNRPIFKLLYVTEDGLDQLPDAWSPNRDNLILGVFKFNNQSPYDITAYDGNIISIDNNAYTINPIADTIGCQHYLGGSDSEPDCNRCLLTDGDLYFDLNQKDLFVYNGWSPVEDIFESNNNYNSGITLYTLTVVKQGTGTGTVTSSPAGINCGEMCTYQFVAGINITLTATPESTSSFDGWSGDVTSSNSTIILTMDSDKTIYANFDLVHYGLTITKSGTGSGTVTSSPAGINCGSTCSYQFIASTIVTLTATPSSSSLFSGWSGDVVDSSPTATIVMDSNKNVTATFSSVYTLTVTKSGTGSGTVISSPAGINCGTTCSYQFASGTSVTLTATPDATSSFGGWSGDVTGTSSTTTVTMNSNKNVTATFSLVYTLTVTKSGTGSGTVTSSPSGINCGSVCSYQFASGTSVTLTATPDATSSFSGWSGDATGTNSTVTITMNSNKNVTATFTLLYTLTVTKSGTGTGTVTSSPSGINCGSTCSYQFASGTNVTLTATSDTGSVFSGWSGDATGTNTTVTITMNSNKSVIATFNSLYTLTVTKSGSGTGTVSSSPAGINCGSTCSYQFVSGTNVTLTATPDSSSSFGGWSGDATGTNTTTTVTMNSNKSVYATFTSLYTLTVTKSGTGSGTVTSSPSGINCGSTCSYQFASGTSVTLTATPDTSSVFSGWSGDATGSSSTVTVTMSSNKSVTATFTPLYTLTVTKSGTGTGTIASSPSGINCGSTCSYQFVSGTSVTLTATPDSTSLFDGWSGDATGSSSTVTVTMSSNKSVTATFNVDPSAGYFAGGGYWTDAHTAQVIFSHIDKLLFSNESRSTLSSTLSRTIWGQSACNSSIAGYFAGGAYNGTIPWHQNFIDKLLFSNESRSTLTATLSLSVRGQSACNSSTAGYFGGGSNYDGDTGGYQSFIDRLIFSTESRSTLGISISQYVMYTASCDSIVSGYFTGGYNGLALYSFIDRLYFMDESRATLSSVLSQSVVLHSACNSSLIAYFAGGFYYDGNSTIIFKSFIDKLFFSTESRATLSTVLSQNVAGQATCNSMLAGYFSGGGNGNFSSISDSSYIDKLLFSSETRSTLAATLSRTLALHSACQSGNIP